ncbi:Dolichyl-phosphate-mannose-protein mannosyltransferase [Pseudarcicella hirudinis]|uniref:Dolichyl-phosphate-mannose-protein mannosyltransferase n=1 Tax=Pseudarcicella hirudinis TaxID=1079859 RepID=A0A1I5Y4Z7_9BACT|nr:glycosyltransferase family 39 protein [Pseudarcicella hirudinis]SFQ39312.1 Dolichyl-phosphate-mannose-protein mannosyltransferase [Pseudarcicella hirudinis]
MEFIYKIFFVLFVGFVFRIASRICNKSLVDIIITAYMTFAGSIIITGFVLSQFNKIDDRRFWALSVFIPAFILYVQFTKVFGRDNREKFTFFEIVGSRIQIFWNWFGSLSLFLKFVFSLLFSSVIIIAVTNLFLVAYTVPNEWDSMTGHLNRVMYYMRHGTMAHFGGTNWNIDTYPKSICTIQIYSYLMSGKVENFFKLIHHMAYWIVGIGAFGIAQRIGKNLTASIFCGLVMLLLPDVLMQSVTTETDIVLASYLTCLIYFLFTYKNLKRRRYLYLAGLTFGIALGHKITFLFSFPPLFFIVLYAVFWEEKWEQVFFKRLKHIVLGTVIGVSLFTLPTGYLKNVEVFGHPIGPPTATKHQSVERAGTLKNLIKQGSRNVVRYSMDMINLDGLRNWEVGDSLNEKMKIPIEKAEKALNLRLQEETDFSIVPFTYHRRFEFFNANPYWGIFGFGLILPIILLVMTGVIRSKPHVFLGIAFILHFMALSYSAPYDPWKGRYFISTSVYAVPFLILLFTKEKWAISTKTFSILKVWVGITVIIGSVSAVSVIYLNERCLPFAALGRPSAFDTERIELETWARPDITPAYKRFNELVPQNAVVALGTINDDYEYPLWGAKLSRTLIPVNPFEKGVQPIPKEAQYLFFSKNVIKPKPGDIRLGTDTTRTDLIVRGEDYYLRKLK